MAVAEIIPDFFALDINGADQSVDFTSEYVYAASYVIFVPEKFMIIFMASARVIGRFGSKLVLVAEIYPSFFAFDTNGAHQSVLLISVYV